MLLLGMYVLNQNDVNYFMLEAIQHLAESFSHDPVTLMEFRWRMQSKG